ncbi:MAG: branched-chain amino acid ABC transporter permease [Candidatus Korarchaeota archaeon NZ13-K]|nr:MAG: branched-chain amino acid ABC transporter permease [Candidatus Korarchaeota archaeon NZ13-K]
MEGLIEVLSDPLFLSIIVNFSIFLIVTLSLNLEVGIAGIPQFGRVLAVLAGAIGAGSIAGRLMALYYGLPWGGDYADVFTNLRIVEEMNRRLSSSPLESILMLVLSLAVAALMGGIIGYLASYPAIRLREAYLGITLLTFGEALQTVVKYYDPIAGGTEGITVPDVFRFVGAGQARFIFSAAVILCVAMMVYIYLQLLIRSPFGRSLKAMRDMEMAARAFGKDIVKLRSQALIIGGSVAALGGALWTLYTMSLKAYTYNRVTWTFWPWAFMMLGGAGNNMGILVGTLAFSTIRSLIFAYKTTLESLIPINPNWLEYILIGLTIVLIAMFRPQGLLPERPELPLSRGRIEALRSHHRDTLEGPPEPSAA